VHENTGKTIRLKPPGQKPADPAGSLPKHIAIIMDGNGRWAKQRGYPRVMGHREGIKSVREVVEACGEIGIEALTLYTFSTENWRRPREEVSALMKLLLKTIQKEIRDLIRNNVRLTVIGDLEHLPDAARESMETAIDKTRTNTGLNLNLALSYGSREELVRAVKRIALQVKLGELDPEAITPRIMQDNLYTSGMPDPDLLIRTSGEFRISNFLLWQLAYTEIYFTDVLWPDFRKPDLIKAIDNFRQRERRFGKVSEQLKR
jgi:undecaprenyl diphosphate synthase